MMGIGREIWKYYLGIYINEQNETKKTANPDSQCQDPDSKKWYPWTIRGIMSSIASWRANKP